ncbi:MAG: uroporphyrinogen-III C-methyltransferase [Methanomassiliicoccales archaeon]
MYLVGAGPGDPDLITVKGRELVSKADVVVHDALIPHQLLELVRGEVIDVGKRGGDHKASQEEINRLMVERAREGKTVVRLKGGDPFLFGRGGEESQFLTSHGVEVHVVPGITSALAVPALAGIPVTHRDHSSQVTVVTGHRGHGKGDPVDWRALARIGGTLVILMGVSTMRENLEELMEGGLPPGTPVAVIEKGATPEQRVFSGQLSTIADICEGQAEAPAIIVVGGVAELVEEQGDLS